MKMGGDGIVLDLVENCLLDLKLSLSLSIHPTNNSTITYCILIGMSNHSAPSR